MSTYQVNLFARRVIKDPEFRELIERDPAAAADQFQLSEEERRALLAADVARLYELGAHDYLLMSLGRFGVLGLDIPTYSERIRKADPRLDY